MRRKEHRDGLKHCSGCGEWRATTSFHAHSERWDRLHAHCKICMTNSYRRRYAKDRERMLEAGRAYRAANPEKRQDTRLRNRFGLSLDEYRRLSAGQSGTCAICRRPEKLHVDHCHSTGVVRGLLCRGCNTAIGALGECVERIRSAAVYVEGFK